MEVAASVGTELALSGLSRVVNKLAKHFGGDVTPEEMEHLNAFVGYEIEALIRQAKSDDLLKSAPLLEKLQAAALELEDLLDLYQYKQIEKQVISSSSSNPIKKLVSKSKEKFGNIIPKSSLRTGLENLLKFVEQVEKKHPFIMSRTVTTQPQCNYHIAPKTSTCSTPFYGRADQCEMIIKLLLDESHPNLNSRTKNVPIIAIIGWAGAGKTTTTQHIYNEHIVENYFDLRMWVHVTLAFDERSLIKETIESAEGKACDPMSNVDALQIKLKESVSKKKFLLVLDDVWEKDSARLDEYLLAPLNQVGEKGSRIILTTRAEKVAEDLHAKPIIPLDDLKDEDCWSILKYYAFDDDEEILENDSELKNVGNQIIKKVKNSPLSLKVVGSSLRNKKSVREWDKILQQEDILKDTMNLLLFSYQCMPLHLQRCFAYCSLFPKGYKFYLDFRKPRPHLIFLWIAQGFLENTNELTLEEVGQKYIEELISYSFFEKEPFDNFIVIHHDLLHDLAENVSKKQCHRIEHHNSLHVPTTCIHLSLCLTKNLVSIDWSTILSNVFNLRNLRSLIVLYRDGYGSIFKSRKSMFQSISKLRALYVDDHRMEVLSDSHIDSLKHLRYLHVWYNSKLPVSLVKVYQLQFFILITDRVDGNRHLSANILPQGFGNLTNLRTLKFYDEDDFEELDYLYYNSKMVNIEKMVVLQNLEKFHVDGFNRMKSLRDLIIGGSFSILNLENVKGKQEAEEAMLNQKKNLDELIFVWSNTASSTDTCEEVLEGLQPHRNLECLEINGYQGVNFPKWTVKENCLPRLRTLRLKSCTSLKRVSFLPPSLKRLKVVNCHELMQLPPLACLKRLDVKNCHELMQLPPLACLKRLDVENCHELMQLHPLPSLEWFDVKNCHKLMQLPPLPSLTWLIIKNCHKLMQLPPFASLEKLEVENCHELMQLPPLPSLRCLKVKNCQKVMQLPPLPSLQWLEVDNCHISLQLPPLPCQTWLKVNNYHERMQLPPLASLQGLIVENCHELMQLPPFSDTLLKLRLIRCPKLHALTNLSPTVTELQVEGCPNLTFNKSPSLCDLSLVTSLLTLRFKGFPNLEALNLCHIAFWLYIEDCPKLTRLGNLQRCPSLSRLVIEKCPMLRREDASLVERVAERDTTNRFLHVEQIATDDPLLVFQLVQQHAFSSITSLILTGCAAAALPNMEMLSSLEGLRIKDCPDVESLPNLPVSLRHLWIRGCPKLKEKYEEGGPLHSTISHLPGIFIS